jgi:hypothetical protein
MATKRDINHRAKLSTKQASEKERLAWGKCSKSPSRKIDNKLRLGGLLGGLCLIGLFHQAWVEMMPRVSCSVVDQNTWLNRQEACLRLNVKLCLTFFRQQLNHKIIHV